MTFFDVSEVRPISVAKSRDKFIPLFLDAKPNEAIHPSSGKTLCFIGIMSDSMSGLAGLNHFKKTRTHKRKRRAALRIAQHIRNGGAQYDVIAVVGKMNGQFASWACDSINNARASIGAEWELDGNAPRKLNWNGSSFDVASGLALCLYAGILPIFGLRASILCRNLETKLFKICLDALPHQSDRAISLITAIMDNNPDFMDMWQQNTQHGQTFEIGVLSTFADALGVNRPAKNHPNFVLADWFAASCLAKFNPNQVEMESGLATEDVRLLASVWDAAAKYGRVTLIDVDDPKLRAEIKEFERYKGQKLST